MRARLVSFASLGALALLALVGCSGESPSELGAPGAPGAPASDAGAPALDAGQPSADAQPPSVDAAPPAADAQAPSVDATTAAPDAQTPSVDAAAPAADAGSPAVDAGGPVLTADGGVVYPPATGALSFTANGRDEARAANALTRGARVRLEWNIPGATRASLAGAGELVVLEAIGAPSFDDMAGGTATAAGSIASAVVPFPVSLLGDRWPRDARVSVSPKGVISRGLQTATSIVDPVLPIPKRTPFGDWVDGTIAAYLDGRFEGRDASARITTKAFDAGLPSERFVVEWSNFTTGADYKPRLAASIRVQAVLFANGAFELRYGALANPATASPLGDGALLRGQGASIGLASSAGVTVAAGQHVQALDPSGTTFRFAPANALPPSGRAVLVLAGNAPASMPLTVTGSNGATASTTLTVADAYAAPATATATFASIRNENGVRALAFGSDSTLPLELPFPVQVFGERWQSLAVFRNAAVGPWGSSVLGMTGGTNFDANPFPKGVSPNGFVAALYPANGSLWCANGGVPTAYALVREGATPPSVTVEWPALHKCGSQALGAVDVQVTIDAAGKVVIAHGAVTPSTGTLTEQTVYVGLENGAGNAARTLSIAPAAAFPGSRSFTFLRP
jgi:hypothetical protein